MRRATGNRYTPYALFILGIAAALADPAAPSPSSPDPFIWLEERTGKRALAWVEAQNQRTRERIESSPRYAERREIALRPSQALSDVPQFGPGSMLDHDWVYSLQQDASHQRGLWRRTRVSALHQKTPDWQTLLDIDALAQKDGKNWVFGNALPQFSPSGRRCMLRLTEGGADKSGSWREFDVEARQFVANGFVVPEATSTVAWGDEETLIVATDFGPGTVTASGHPRVVKAWRRGQPLAKARQVFRTSRADSIAIILSWPSDAKRRTVVINDTDVQRANTYWRLGESGQVSRLNLPQSGWIVGFSQGEWIVLLSSDWRVGTQTWPSGALVSVSGAEDTRPPQVRVLAVPGARETITDVMATRDSVLVSAYSNVRGRLLRFTSSDAGWATQPIPLRDNGSVRIMMADAAGKTAYVLYEDFLSPQTLYEVDLKAGTATSVKSAGAEFDSNCCLTEQWEATSKDGTKIPYFVVRPKALAFNAAAPTLLQAYGGNGIPLYPEYSGTTGRLWLEKGGVYVVANIRGGGEFGPAWHQAALKTKRQRSYDDFIAVAEDLIRRKITSPEHLGIYGHSNGGLVMAVALNQRPDLFNAAILSEGVLDTIRVDLMSTRQVIAERGSPDIPEERAFLEKTSPYQNLAKRPHFPPPLLLTSTTDEVVHPALTRKYAAKLESLGMPFFFLETSEGGHGQAATPEGKAGLEALKFTYLADRLSLAERGQSVTN